ncbi:MAG TPA: EF-hand domain-containing protein, partial [Gemmataceae bacterium]|nr:EF-hand domain-containing protein [Gemmataceae bacterium]
REFLSRKDTHMLYRVLPRAVAALALVLLLRAPAKADEARQAPSERATIQVDLPEDARLTFDGESTASTGSHRVFFSPPLVRGKEYSYTLRAERMRGGEPTFLSKTITVRPGEETRVDLRRGYATAAGGEEVAEDRVDKAGATPLGKGRRFDLERFLKDYDTDKDGRLTRNELPPELRPAFDRIDADKDGKVSREELQRGIAHLQPARRHSDLIHVLIEMSDCDDACHGEVQRAYDILRKLDKNKDGKIDADELKTAREQIVKDRVDYLFKELDKNKDEKISRDEAQGMLRQDFDPIDRNKDGFINREELTRAATARLEASPAQDK